jgi:TolA-binding protein
MSRDPERLLSATSADPLERELLGSVRHVVPPEGAQDRAWQSIVAQIAVGAAVGAVSSSAAAAASKAPASTLISWALSTKLALVAAGGLALGGGYVALHSAKPRSTGKPAVAAVTPAIHGAPAESAVPERVVVAAPPSERPPDEDAPSRKPEPPKLDRLKAESALLTNARAQLRAGNATAAQASLERLQAQFPKGMLTQEREVLGIEVSYARGNVEGAKRRAQAFVKAYPNSPHSAKLSRFLE